MFRFKTLTTYLGLFLLTGIVLLALTPQAQAWNEFNPKQTITVGCSGSTYTDLPPAVAAAKPFTLILVCKEGSPYSGGSSSVTDHLKIQGKDKAREVVIDCNSTPNQDGIDLLAAHDYVDNLTVQNCSNGVLISNQDLGIVATVDNRVTNSIFSNDAVGIFAEDCQQCQLTNNQINNIPTTGTGLTDFFTVDDVVSGNKIDCGSAGNDGMYVVEDEKVTVSNNTVTGGCTNAGFEIDTDADSKFTNNKSNGNENGFYLDADNINNLFQDNTTDKNTTDGFFVNATNGANVTAHSEPNKFKSNKSDDNGSFDYNDQTFGCGLTANTCSTWSQNAGDVCNPAGICSSPI
jgi:parallel beta-helix repeat protein